MNTGNTTVVQETMEKRGQLKMIWMRFKKNRRAMFGVVLLALILIAIFLGSVLIDYDENVVKMVMSDRLQGMSAAHPLGTDHYGRDLLARVLHGGRISILLSMGIIVVAFGLGLLIGAVSGYCGGKVDNIIMRIMDIFIAIPYTLFAICVVAALGTSYVNLVVAMTIGLAPRFSRVVRSFILPLRGQEYVEAARACGTSHARIIAKHILPNAIGPILVQVTLEVANTIKAIAGLSFIGLGVQAPAPEWGLMLNEGKQFMRDVPGLVIIPGIAIVLTAVSFNLIGDGLRDAIDPRLKN